MPKWLDARLDALEFWIRDKQRAWDEFFGDRRELAWWSAQIVPILVTLLIALVFVLGFLWADYARRHYQARADAAFAAACRGFVPSADTRDIGSEGVISLKALPGVDGLQYDKGLGAFVISTAGEFTVITTCAWGGEEAEPSVTVAEWGNSPEGETGASIDDCCPDTITLYPLSPLKYVKWTDPNTGQEITLTLPKKVPAGRGVDTFWVNLAQGLRRAAARADVLMAQAETPGGVTEFWEESFAPRAVMWAPARFLAADLHQLELDCCKLGQAEAERARAH